MKKISVFFIAIIILIVGIFVIKNNLEKKYNIKIEEISNINYYIFKANNLYGVIDENGTVIIDANYDKIIIPNPSIDLFACYKGEKSNILNSKNERILDKFDSVEPIKLKNVENTLSYEKSVLKYKKDEKYGLISFNGKTITKNVYDSLENLQPTEGKFLVSQNSKYGVIDLNGNKLVDTKYDQCNSDEFYSKDNGYIKSGFIVINKTDDGYKYGYISYNGKKILDVKYNDIERIQLTDDNKIYLIASINGKYGLFNKSKKILDNDYQEIIYDDNVNLLMLQKNKKYGVASLDGKILIDVNCDEISSRGIYFYTTSSGTNKVYDSNANIIDINFNSSVYNTQSDDYKISTILNNNITYYGILDKNGNKLVEDKYRYLEYLYKNYFTAIDDEGNIGIINSNGKTILDMKYSSIQKIKEKNIVQTIDSNGISEFYSETMEKVLEIEKPNVSIQDDYVIISNETNKTYLDNQGNIINDISNLKKENYPDQINDFKKEIFPKIQNIIKFTEMRKSLNNMRSRLKKNVGFRAGIERLKYSIMLLKSGNDEDNIYKQIDMER